MIQENSVDIATKSWARMKYSQKKQILHNLGHSTTFAKTKSVNEMVQRGGGMAAKSFLNLVNEYKKRNPQLNKIRWV